MIVVEQSDRFSETQPGRFAYSPEMDGEATEELGDTASKKKNLLHNTYKCFNCDVLFQIIESDFDDVEHCIYFDKVSCGNDCCDACNAEGCTKTGKIGEQFYLKCFRCNTELAVVVLDPDS